jgi:hypothetical protein
MRILIDEKVQRQYEKFMADTSKRLEDNESKANRCLSAFTSYSEDARKMKEMVDGIN